VTNADGTTSFWYGEADRTTALAPAPNTEALAAFFPAELALSGDLDRARRLQDSNYKMWTAFGIEPELIDYSTMKRSQSRLRTPGPKNRIGLYLYYFTRDPKYRQMGMTFYSSIVQYCRTPSAFAALSSVENEGPARRHGEFLLRRNSQVPLPASRRPPTASICNKKPSSTPRPIPLNLDARPIPGI